MLQTLSLESLSQLVVYALNISNTAIPWLSCLQAQVLQCRQNMVAGLRGLVVLRVRALATARRHDHDLEAPGVHDPAHILPPDLDHGVVLDLERHGERVKNTTWSVKRYV